MLQVFWFYDADIYCLLIKIIEEDFVTLIKQHSNFILMQRYLKLALKSLTIAASLGGVTLLGAFTYLQYINSKLGPLEIDHQTSTKYYIQQLKMNPTQAHRMYYWIQFDIAFMRILGYRSYSNYCQKLDTKIVQPAIKNYENQGLISKIQTVQAVKQKNLIKKLFDEVNEVRKKNFVNFQTQQYIIKQLRKHQKLLDTRRLVNISDEKLKKVDKIHAYICQAGSQLKVKEVQEYLTKIPAIQSHFPGDWLHKILYI